MDLLKSASLQKADGSNAPANCLDGKAVVLIYFSAHWCPPCRAFTPMLKDFYEVRQGFFKIALFLCKSNKFYFRRLKGKVLKSSLYPATGLLKIWRII